MDEDIALYSFVAVLVLIIAGLCWFLYAAVASGANEREAFIAECQQHEPHYRCVAMWRAGENHSSTVVVPVVTGR